MKNSSHREGPISEYSITPQKGPVSQIQEYITTSHNSKKGSSIRTQEHSTMKGSVQYSQLPTTA